MSYETTIEMELALSRFFKIRKNLIVPNIHWGMFHYELDLLIISKACYGTEIEIKISKGDLKKDKEKEHGHRNDKIKKFYFAIPEKIDVDFALKHIPERAGLIVVNKKGRCVIVKSCVYNKCAFKFTQKEMFQIARLGALRIWGLKQKLINKGNK